MTQRRTVVSKLFLRFAQQPSLGSQTRYWSDEEHQKFLEGVNKFGAKDVRAIAFVVGTRTPTQVRSHAQKFFMKLASQNKSSEAREANWSGETRTANLACVGWSSQRRLRLQLSQRAATAAPLPQQPQHSSQLTVRSATRMHTARAHVMA
jgi:SHAQKYF class myb-like DNA-binding protein